jgi:hypothetical protein
VKFSRILRENHASGEENSKTPNPKLQRNLKQQNPKQRPGREMFGGWDLELLWCLEVGA